MWSVWRDGGGKLCDASDEGDARQKCAALQQLCNVDCHVEEATPRDPSLSEAEILGLHIDCPGFKQGELVILRKETR